MKENKDLISVIVPVYNVEKYIRRCLDSIVNQTYSNLEIILIDDGSKDASGKICDEYAKKDNRITVIHKKNGGLSDTRNVGINAAKGKYITFVDSDDIICCDYIEHLYYLLKKYNCKMSISGLEIVPSKNKKNDKYIEEKIEKTEALRRLLVDDISVSSCSKLYEISLFKDVHFPKGKLYEDNGTTYKLIEKCDSIGYSNKKIYKYYRNSNSITNKKFDNRKLDLIELTDEMCNDLLKYNELHNAIGVKRNEARFSIARQVVLSKPFDKNVYAECKRFIIDNKKYIFNNPDSNSRQKKAYYILMLGPFFLKLAWKIYSKYMK